MVRKPVRLCRAKVLTRFAESKERNSIKREPGNAFFFFLVKLKATMHYNETTESDREEKNDTGLMNTE